MKIEIEHVAIIITMIVSIGGMASGFMALKSQRKKDLSQASESIAEAAKTLIEPLRKRIEHLESENRELKGKSHELEMEIRVLKESLYQFRVGTERLIFQLKALNVVPVWKPEKKE
jgi:predicted RNase H-like nuclease (RuvC/YqgF family)